MRNNINTMKYIYGPVKSRRLGLSLGVSPIPYKTCNFDCVYCQLGRTPAKTKTRKNYFPIEAILAELKTWLKENQSQAKKIKFITLSGLGEPTLHLKLGEVISKIKKISKIPLAVITNSSYLASASARKSLLEAELIVPSLDAVRQAIFEKIDRPAPGIEIGKIISGLIKLRQEFSGKIWLEIMLVKGVNDSLEEIKRMAPVIAKIKPDKIQLNSPVRAACEPDVFPLTKEKLLKIKKILAKAGRVNIL